MFEERRQVSHCDVAALVYGGGEDRTTVLAVPDGVICAAPKKGYPKWRAGNDHMCALELISRFGTRLRFSILNSVLSHHLTADHRSRGITI